MPRPKSGYRNAAGEIIPGTSDITKRFADSKALIYWAFQQGRKGLKDPYDGAERDIGTCVHMMAEMDLRGEPEENIDHYVNQTFRDPDQLKAALTAFRAYRQWRARFHVDVHIQEISLVSEKYQFGGTLDIVAHMRGGLGLVDFKTSKAGAVYPDHVWQLAAYGQLWNENHPNEPLTAGYHLITLPKDGSRPVHREYSEEHIKPFFEQFTLFRRCWDLEDYCANKEVLAGGDIAPSIAPERPAKTIRRPTVRIEAPTHHPMSMAEIMRAYGHTTVTA